MSVIWETESEIKGLSPQNLGRPKQEPDFGTWFWTTSPDLTANNLGIEQDIVNQKSADTWYNQSYVFWSTNKKLQLVVLAHPISISSYDRM